ncbi:3'(2'),5'-bisphosphate nucleotidase CysQ [Sphingomonas glaciei]|uniref:3'(2'),5'-bisphosphate nucleotidase CysQ n=1 Tax=Sphingomonas glaciei TaxID=2938948 RepID=A0ABY5MXZ8_9SPHN|nr:3'(2'),5'-bisphosphate nucleotidase CysQ [Sphingomonas glaciei]UUR09188.1 3'(2'),5'-bisphosphate nucleotidase CysQ [Sphingomonas glaciei]
MDLAALLEPLGLACREAGEAIRAVRRRGFDVAHKGDLSPVTEADHAAEAIILAALARHAPGIPVVAEEEAAAGRIPDLADAFFLVDPLDGTREYVRGGDDYTVNIGLVVGGSPVLGLVLAPEQGRLWAGIVGGDAWVEEAGGTREPLRVRVPGERLTVVASKSHMNQATRDFLAAEVPEAELVSVGSSLKFCLLAESAADYYPRLSPTSEWDTAAGHAVLLAAGGRVDAPDGSPLGYGKPSFLNPGFAASSGWRGPLLAPYMPD